MTSTRQDAQCLSIGLWAKSTSASGAVCAALLSLAPAFFCRAAPAAVPLFQDGDRVCFIGDSITGGSGKYHELIHLYYLSKFKGNPANMAEVKAHLDNELAGVTNKAVAYLNQKTFDSYMANKPNADKLQAEIVAIVENLYQVNQPKPHQYELERTGGTRPKKLGVQKVGPQTFAFRGDDFVDVWSQRQGWVPGSHCRSYGGGNGETAG